MEDWQDLADLIPVDDPDLMHEVSEIISEVMDCE